MSRKKNRSSKNKYNWHSSFRAIEYQKKNIGKMTKAEKICNRVLSELSQEINFTFYPQYIFMPNPNKPDEFFLLDFYIYPPINTIIEVDGGYHTLPEQIQYDNWRQSILEQYGANVIRYKNAEWETDAKFAKESLRLALSKLIGRSAVSPLPTLQSVQVQYANTIKPKKKHRKSWWNIAKSVISKPARVSNAPKMFKNEAELKEWFRTNNAVILGKSQEATNS